jgi:hypothetical protein
MPWKLFGKILCTLINAQYIDWHMLNQMLLKACIFYWTNCTILQWKNIILTLQATCIR